MKAFFYQLIRELQGSLSGCRRVLRERREGLGVFTRRHPDWKYTALGCLLFPPFLVIGAGLILMGLVTHGAGKAIDS